MNLMEEIPKDKGKRSSSNKQPAMFNLFSTADSVVPSQSSQTNTAYSGPSTTSYNGSPYTSSSSSSSSKGFSLGGMDTKTFMIVILLCLVIFSYFGVQLLNLFGDAIQKGVAKLSPIVTDFLDLLGYSTGKTINKTADITADVAKAGIDIAEGTVQNIGNLMIGDEAIGKGPNQKSLKDPSPDNPEDTIQKSITSGKTKWCLVGEYEKKRGCIDISESDKCMSGQVFPNEEMCLRG